ncbi:hypothetical protein I4U23_000059 [Adineta vaga]|nr:hypothetical protein I4U23_000059 [Adineta vaga]
MELSTAVINEHDQAKIFKKQPRRRPVIHVFTGLRALACLWVFAAHRSVEPTAELRTLNIGWLGHAGGAGVAVFFCLSGFIMVWVYSDCEFKSYVCYWSFIGRRVGRLFPLYYLSLAISIYDVKCIWSTDKPCTLVNWTNIVLTFLGIKSWVPYVFTDLIWSVVAWSVQTEFFFYVAFPGVLRLIRYLINIKEISLPLDEQVKRRTMKRLYLLWFLVFFISGIILFIRELTPEDPSIPFISRQTQIFYYLPLTRIPEFILGAITGIIFILKSSNDNSDQEQSDVDATTALISNNKQQRHIGFPSSLKNYFSNYKYCYLAFDSYFVCQVVFFMIIYSPLFTIDLTLTRYDEILFYGPIISLIVCIVLYFSAKYPQSLTSKLLASSLLVDMGDISYAFYILVETLPRLLQLIAGVDDTSFIMRLWAGIGIAAFAHYYIEMPVYNWVNTKLPKCQCTYKVELPTN